MAIEDDMMAVRKAASVLGKKGGPAAAKVRFSKMSEEQRKAHGAMLAESRRRARKAREQEAANG